MKLAKCPDVELQQHLSASELHVHHPRAGSHIIVGQQFKIYGFISNGHEQNVFIDVFCAPHCFIFSTITESDAEGVWETQLRILPEDTVRPGELIIIHVFTLTEFNIVDRFNCTHAIAQ